MQHERFSAVSETQFQSQTPNRTVHQELFVSHRFPVSLSYQFNGKREDIRFIGSGLGIVVTAGDGLNLTLSQLEILQLFDRGLPWHQIADRLGLKPQTILNQMYRSRQRNRNESGVRPKTKELLAKAESHGMLDPNFFPLVTAFLIKNKRGLSNPHEQSEGL